MSKPSILIVEDEIIIARELEVRLRAMGYEVVGIASSGLEAIEKAGSQRPDLILMDIVLKGDLDGVEAADQIRNRFAIPFIYLTAYTDKSTLDRARVTEPYGYIVKPFSERELHANIEMALYKHRTESRARKIEKWFSHAVDDNTHAVLLTDGEGVITHINPAAESLTRWSRVEAVGQPLREVLRLKSRAHGGPIHFDDAAEGPLICLAEDTLLVDRMNNSLPVENSTSFIRDEANRPVGSVSVLRDVGGKRFGFLVSLGSDVALATAQASSLTSMLSYCAEALVKNLGAAFARIWTLASDNKTLVLQASAGMYTHLDGAHSRIPVGQFKIGRIAQSLEPHLTNDVLNDPWIGDPEWARREGLTAFAGHPLLVDGRLVGVMAIFSRTLISESVLEALASVSNTIAVGIERKRLEDRLMQSAKMEAIGQLAGGVAHDFNNLLTIIGGYSSILLSDNRLADRDREQVEQIAAAGDRASSLTRQLLAFSRRQILAPRALRLNALLMDLEKMLRRLIGEDIALSISTPPELFTVLADPSQMEQVIMNLAVNARDAMPQGGNLEIRLSNVHLDERHPATHFEVPPGEYAQLEVADSGTGMPPEIRERIFEPFFTTKDQGKGTGLGLATVYGVVKQSGGHIDVSSELGLGTTFRVYLPRCAAPAESPGIRKAFTVLPRGNERILLVEDEVRVRSLCQSVLSACGYSVTEASNGMDAWKGLSDPDAYFDLVLTDVVMPEMSGPQLAVRLREAHPEIPIVFMSGYHDDAVIQHGVLPADAPYLQKPFTPSALATKLREVLDKKKAQVEAEA